VFRSSSITVVRKIIRIPPSRSAYRYPPDNILRGCFQNVKNLRFLSGRVFVILSGSELAFSKKIEICLDSRNGLLDAPNCLDRKNSLPKGQNSSTCHQKLHTASRSYLDMKGRQKLITLTEDRIRLSTSKSSLIFINFLARPRRLSPFVRQRNGILKFGTSLVKSTVPISVYFWSDRKQGKEHYRR
jgi:hypothetical protein